MTESSPFDLVSDPEGDKNALTQALQIVKGFALYFVVSEVSRVRPRMMEEIEARFPSKKIQRIQITKATTNLLHLLQEELDDPLPDIVFVSGFENVISANAEPRSHSLLLNINATRNNFYALLPRPVVLWVPPFVLKAILQAAPDFISVRSGVYTFALSTEEREQMKVIASATGQREILAYGGTERSDRISEMQSLLSEYRSLPENERNIQDEALLLNRLGIAYTSLGNYNQAEPLYDEALAIRRASLPAEHPNIATSLNNLATLYDFQGRYKEAELLFNEALDIKRANLPKGHPDIATSLNNLAALYKSQGRYKEAEALCDEALSIRRAGLPYSYPYIATSLNNLATLYESQGRYEEAEALYNEGLAIDRASLPEGHPYIATSLNNLATLYRYQGRYKESEPLFNEALAIRRTSLPQEHPDIAMSLNNLATLYDSQGRNEEAELLFNEAIEILHSAFSEEHPYLQAVRHNFALFLKNKTQLSVTTASSNSHNFSLESVVSTFGRKPYTKVDRKPGETTPRRKKLQRKEPKFRPFR